jgi:hypothetical protein
MNTIQINFDLLSFSTSSAKDIIDIGFIHIIPKPTTARQALIDHIYIKDIFQQPVGFIQHITVTMMLTPLPFRY